MLSIILELETSSNHRLESAGLNALEELLFKMLGKEKMMHALFWKRDRKLALLSILTSKLIKYSIKEEGAGHEGMLICSKVGQNLSEMEDSTL